jgi:hypothetical protein
MSDKRVVLFVIGYPPAEDKFSRDSYISQGIRFLAFKRGVEFISWNFLHRYGFPK